QYHELASWNDSKFVEFALYSKNNCGQGISWSAFKNYQLLSFDNEKSKNFSWVDYKGNWGPRQLKKDSIPFQIAGITFYTFNYESVSEGPAGPNAYSYE
ncbi:MAG: hypothetical protein HQK51_18600, partial [Oligoflexia bacterium]|nr:hypothetical protein [Oligoflexia bacterium]